MPAVRPLIAPWPDIDVQPTPTQLAAPEGALFKWGLSYPSLYSLPGDSEVETHQLDFPAVFPLSTDDLLARADQYTAYAAENGSEVLLYAVYEKPIWEIQVPDHICAHFLGQSFCFDNPFGGQLIQAGWQYRIYMVTRDFAAPMASADARPFLPVLTFGTLIGYSVLVGLLGIVLAGLFEVFTGKITLKELVNNLRTIYKVPGEIITPPLIFGGAGLAVGLGIVLVAGAILLPRFAASTSVGVSRKEGPSAGVTIGAGGAPARAPTPRRR